MEPKRKQPSLVAKTARLAGGPLSQKKRFDIRLARWTAIAPFESTRWQAESFTLLGPQQAKTSCSSHGNNPLYTCGLAAWSFWKGLLCLQRNCLSQVLKIAHCLNQIATKYTKSDFSSMLHAGKSALFLLQST